MTGTKSSNYLLQSRPGSLSLSDVLDGAARRWPEKAALVFDHSGEVLSFADLAEKVQQTATHLATECGVARGSRVALLLANVPAFPITWLALAHLGATAVPLNVFLASADLRAVIDDSGAALVVTDEAGTKQPALIEIGIPVVVVPGVPGTLANHVPVTGTADAELNIQFTSGSTGRSKGCVLTQSYWVEIARTMASHGPRIVHQDVLLTAQPFYYMDPMWNLSTALATGATLVVADRFHPRTFWQTVRRRQVTYFYCLGVMPALLLTTEVDPEEKDHSVRYISCSAIPRGRHAELESRYGAPWYELYGSTETGIDVMVEGDDHDLAAISGCLGTLVPNREIRILDPDTSEVVSPGDQGLLYIRGTFMAAGYLDTNANSSAFTAGWYCTGDLVSRDQTGALFFHGRVKDIIRRSGENISAAQVEHVLNQHPAVAMSACLPVDDDIRGEEIKAYVVTDEDPDLLIRPLIAFTAERLAYFKVPRYWEFRHELPLTSSEKVSKPLIRKEPQRGSCFDRAIEAWVASPPVLG